MSWKWMDLVTDYLNPDALGRCRDYIISMSHWAQGILVCAVLLLAGTAFLELLFGLHMQRYACFVSGLAVGFAVCFVILQGYVPMEETKLLLFSLASGIVCGVLNAFAQRVFRFAEGFLFGTALGTWLVPDVLGKDLSEDPGRIFRLLIAIACGALAALLAGKLKFVLSALAGGAVLGLLTESFVRYESIPYVPEVLELSEGMYRNILPLVLAGIGILIQLPQWIGQLRREKEMKSRAADDTDTLFSASAERTDSETGQEEEDQAAGTPDTAVSVTIAEAEAVLVEKARELAQAAARSAEDIRLHERYEDVAQGLYGPEAAAGRLGISQEDFLTGMRKAGYELPQTKEGADMPGGAEADAQTEVQLTETEESSAGEPAETEREEANAAAPEEAPGASEIVKPEAEGPEGVRGSRTSGIRVRRAVGVRGRKAAGIRSRRTPGVRGRRAGRLFRRGRG